MYSGILVIMYVNMIIDVLRSSYPYGYLSL